MDDAGSGLRLAQRGQVYEIRQHSCRLVRQHLHGSLIQCRAFTKLVPISLSLGFQSRSFISQVLDGVVQCRVGRVSESHCRLMLRAKRDVFLLQGVAFFLDRVSVCGGDAVAELKKLELLR
jgi:hypothetical protein